MQQGYPISEELLEQSDIDGKTYTVQYFERAVFEYHPELPAGKNVLLSLLGSFEYSRKYPNGAPNQKPSAFNPVRFKETGKTIGGRFRAYWEKNGALPQYGYPISDEFQELSELDGNTYIVQYFQRVVFEHHPENKPPHDVLLSQLGTFRYNARYAPLQPLPPTFMRSDGVLYIRAEYYQSQGVSIWKAIQRGAPFQELTTIHEWWIDANNPYRFLEARTELLENGPQQVYAEGANGADTWWELSVSRYITTPLYHQGLSQHNEQMTMDSWIYIFSRSGQRTVQRLKSGEVQQLDEEDRTPWGKLLIIRGINTQNGVATTSAVRAEEPRVQVEFVTKGQAGKIVQSYVLTRWEWYDTKQIWDGFWMRPPTADVADNR
jgi:hypothetical protein